MVLGLYGILDIMLILRVMMLKCICKIKTSLTFASGLYSLKDDKWITEPSYDPPSIDIRDVFKKANAIESDIEILKEKILKARGTEAKRLHDRAKRLKEKYLKCVSEG
jgi:hypothetical protein